MTGSPDAHAEVLAQALAYGEAVCFARAEVFEAMCHERFTMTLVGPDGPTYWDKQSYLERVRSRGPADTLSFGIMDIDVAGDEIARVHCWVDVEALGTRFEDHLGFIKENGRWLLLTKVFRSLARLDGEE